MNVRCPNCGFEGNIPDDKIPEKDGRNIKCPKCKQWFFIKKTKTQDLLGDSDVQKLHKITLTPRKKKSVLDKFTDFIQPEELVKKSQALNTFKNIFRKSLSDNVITEKEVDYMKLYVKKKGLDWSEAVGAVRAEATKHMNEYISFAKNDGVIDDEEDRYINRLLGVLEFNQKYIESVKKEINHIKLLDDIRHGSLPRVENPYIILKSSEICYYQTSKCLFSKTGSNDNFQFGKLIVTNQRLIFMGEVKNFHITIKQILDIDCYPMHLSISATVQKGSGIYEVDDSELVSEIILYLLKKVNMHIVENSNITRSRHISHDTKINVWQRDGGRCNNCGAEEYLEFDHIIPFSKGGSNSEKNIQLLCRRCNSEKGSEI